MIFQVKVYVILNRIFMHCFLTLVNVSVRVIEWSYEAITPSTLIPIRNAPARLYFESLRISFG